MQNTPERMIKDMVTEDFRTAAVFEKYSIDFCCGGKKPLEAACLEQGVDVADVLADLHNLDRRQIPAPPVLPSGISTCWHSTSSRITTSICAGSFLP